MAKIAMKDVVQYATQRKEANMKLGKFEISEEMLATILMVVFLLVIATITVISK